MGLDVVMIGEDELKSAREDPAFNVLVQYLVQTFPEAANVPFGKSPKALSEGDRIGSYSAIHVLRGLALAMESAANRIDGMTEDEFGELSDRFYEQEDPQTRFQHLLNHPDDSGYYIPVAFDEPFAVEATVDGDDEPVFVASGSSPGLVAELNTLNEILGLSGDAGEMSSEAFEQMVAAHKWPTAAYVWGVLRHYARESADKFLIIVFC